MKTAIKWGVRVIFFAGVMIYVDPIVIGSALHDIGSALKLIASGSAEMAGQSVHHAVQQQVHHQVNSFFNWINPFSK